MFSATPAIAQTIPPQTFKHIIIVVQENRTPDNLFGAYAGPITTCLQEPNPTITGADLDNGGHGYINGTRQLICNMSLTLSGYDPEKGGVIDPDHTFDNYGNGGGWVADYHGGAMDGFCHEFVNNNWAHPCPSYSYVPLGDQHGDIAPYFQIAQTYGFGNYMFQTHQGPSFEAHQFLFSGTSAPVAPGVSPPDDLDFVAELAGNNYGCQQTTAPNWVDPTGSEFSGDPTIAECFQHDTLVTAQTYCPQNNHEGYCDRGVSWGYYAPPPTGSHQGVNLDCPAGQPANLLRLKRDAKPPGLRGWTGYGVRRPRPPGRAERL